MEKKKGPIIKNIFTISSFFEFSNPPSFFTLVGVLARSKWVKFRFFFKKATYFSRFCLHWRFLFFHFVSVFHRFRMGPGRKPAPNFYDVADMHVEKNVWETHLTDTEKHRYLLKAATDFLNLPPDSTYKMSSFQVFPTPSGYAVFIPHATLSLSIKRIQQNVKSTGSSIVDVKLAGRKQGRPSFPTKYMTVVFDNLFELGWFSSFFDFETK